jgi:uncharacterized membrane protein (UPF0127 family)
VTTYLRIWDETRDTVVAERCRVAESIVQRIFGLHLLPKLEPGEGLLLRGSTTIDTTFMRYPIDLVFVDRARRVTKTVGDLPPWRMVLRTAGGHDCIELPAGTVATSGVRANDELSFTPVD